MTNFKAVLLNTKFDREYRNVLRFDTREAQEEYFNLPSLFSNAENINFNAGSLLETTMIYRIRENESLNDILSKNYCIVQDLNENRALQYYFYFIRNAMQDAGGQVKLWLELDIFQTYYIDLDFTPCAIKRAHLNRFVDAEQGKIKFDGKDTSTLFFTEDISSSNPQRLTKMEKIKWKITGNEDLDEWFDQRVAFWVYFFVDKTHQYTEYTLNGDKKSNVDGEFYNGQIRGITSYGFKPEYGIICFPIYKNSGQIFFRQGSKEYLWDDNSFSAWQDDNGGASYIYAIKASLKPPFMKLNATHIAQFEISGNRLYINFPSTTSADASAPPLLNDRCSAILTSDFATRKHALLTNLTQYGDPLESYDVNLDFQFEFDKQQILGPTNEIFNPKLLNMQNRTLRIKSFDGTFFDYDIQKLNSNIVSFLYNEPIQPEITKYYCRLKAPKGLYVEDTSKNLLGLIGSNDNTISLSNDQYKAFLANNKNFWLQSTLKIVSGGIRDIGQSAIAGKRAGIEGGIQNAISGTLSQFFDKALTLDNLKESPDTLKNAQGNLLFSMQVNEIGMFVEILETLPGILKEENQKNILYGYVYDLVDDIKKCDNIRKFYNYVEAEIEETTGINISNAVHDKFRQAFRNGVRFWNSDDFNFDKENYERWLENG